MRRGNWIDPWSRLAVWVALGVWGLASLVERGNDLSTRIFGAIELVCLALAGIGALIRRQRRQSRTPASGSRVA